MSRRCSITSGTPPAMNTCTVGWSSGPFGSASTSRGVARLTRFQSSTVGGRSPAACAMAGMCSRRLVEPPNAACSSIAFSIARGVRMAESGMPCAASRTSARADCRASVQPDRLARRAERAVRQRDPERLGHHLRGGGRPEELAAAARRCRTRGSPCSAASSALMRPCANRAPIVWTLPASSAPVAGSVTPPGTMMPGRWPQPASASIMAGRPLSQVAMPITPARRGSDRIRRRIDDGRVVAVRQAVEHPGRALRAAVARVAAVRGERHDALRAQRLRRLADQQADLPVAGVVAERDGRPSASRSPPCVLRMRYCGRPTSAGSQPIPAFWVMPNRWPLGSVEQHLRRDRQPPGGPLRREACRGEPIAAAAEQGVQIILRHPVATIPRQ